MIVDKLIEKIREKGNPCCVGLDPVVERLPKQLIQGQGFSEVAVAFKRFNFAIIDAVADLVPAVKPQIAFYEKYGVPGLEAFKSTVDYAHSKDLIVVEDGKRNDISSTAQAYADAHLGLVNDGADLVPSLNVDFLTANPYLGTDGLHPFVQVCKDNGKGIFILVKTSNPSSGEFQDRLVEINQEDRELFQRRGVEFKDKTQLYNLVALKVDSYSLYKGEYGYSPIGAVVGATYPEQAETLRKIMPRSYFLVPGYGAQGATADDIVPCFDEDGLGAIVNASRSIIYAWEEKNVAEDYARAARQATLRMIEDITSALRRAGKYHKL